MGKTDTSNTPTHDRSLSWLDTGTSIKGGRVKLVLWAQTQFEYDINFKLKKKKKIH